MALFSPGLRGLVLPDLDAPAVALPAAPPEPSLDELLAAAREEGRAAGLREGEARGRAAEQASRDTLADEAIRIALTHLDQAQEAARQEVERHAHSLAAMLADLVDAALPGAAAREAPALLEPLMRALGPVEDAPDGAVLRVPPALLDHARARFGGTGLPIEADPALPEGDARITWRHGGLDLDLSRRRAAIRDVLAALRLSQENDA
ncbi:FliH/SctL family protein [Muricoccus pecuniae]|uniref:Flagellar biosynthesis/type III secretory pathway protein FliH n=1 Tax=Muricoccus pecuniae TaxID=693023 RepID=A0A840Y9S8_9PROT|nr:FliH/SctL family protein [Roseomonas pecuniae]MBB5692751.1 flagellar biosynthesis/type III secretory pathway protein FliH [Roseomonas pecuniae]